MSLSQKVILATLLVFCTLALSLLMLRSGLRYPFGLGFWGPAGHDGIWHLSLINHISHPFFVPNPSFSGEKLTNYHPFYDILATLIAKTFHLNPSFVLFQVLPLAMSFCLLFLSFFVGKNFTGSFWGGLFLMFLNTFATSFGPLISLIRDHRFGGESLFWAMQSFSTQINPPYALSLVFLLLLLLILTQPALKIGHYLLLVALLILLPITKAYAGVVAFFIFIIFSLLQKRRANFFTLATSLPLAYLVFRSYNPSSINLLEFNPLWFIRSLFESPDKLYLPKVASYLLNTRFNLNHLLIYIFGITVFLFGNFGFRSLFLLKTKSFLSRKYLPLIGAIILTAILPLIFIQKGTAWNTIQFLYYGQFIGNILLAHTLTNLTRFRFVLILTIIVFSLLGNIQNFSNYLGYPPPASLPDNELSALKFFNTLPPGIVLTYPYDIHLKEEFLSTPLPLYVYETTAYVSAYTHHLTYLADEMNLDNSAYPWQSRRFLSDKFFRQLPKELFENRGFLLQNQIDYIYLTGVQQNQTSLNSDKLFLKTLYNQDGISIYQVLK